MSIRIETTNKYEAIQFTGFNFTEIVNFIYKVHYYTILIEKDKDGNFVVGMSQPTILGQCIPMAGRHIIIKSNWLVRCNNNDYFEIHTNHMFNKTYGKYIKHFT